MNRLQTISKGFVRLSTIFKEILKKILNKKLDLRKAARWKCVQQAIFSGIIDDLSL